MAAAFAFRRPLASAMPIPGVFFSREVKLMANDQVVKTLSEVLATLKCSRSSLYAWIEDQGFPKPLKFGSNSRWLAAEVEEWIERRAADR